MDSLSKLLKNKSFYIYVFLFVIGIVVGVMGTKSSVITKIINQTNGSPPPSGTLEAHSGQFNLIDPLYECNTGENYGQEKLTSLEKTISDYIDKIEAGNSTERASVYFRDLNNGPWFGINETDEFSPSSLLKVPVMMAYYKYAEDNPAILNKKIKYTVDPPGLLPQNFPPSSPLVKGKTYTIEELIERMIIQSDNVALYYLEQNIDPNLIDKVTIDLGITTATNTTPQDFMNVQEYSTLFRVLYYATYLNQQYSQQALKLLSQADFTNGIVAPLPKNLTVAHKFGERDLGNGEHQLHDCGVVYNTGRPYLLCIMTKGPNYPDLEATIQQISNKVYKEFTRFYP